jgi:hypothetical protein
MDDDRCPELEPDEGDGTHFWRSRPDGTRSCEWCLQVKPARDDRPAARFGLIGSNETDHGPDGFPL